MMKKKEKKNKVSGRLKDAGKTLASKAGSLNPLRPFNAGVRFLKNAYGELRTVTWLSRKDTVKFSIYILLFLVLSALTIALTDLGLFRLVTFITTSS